MNTTRLSLLILSFVLLAISQDVKRLTANISVNLVNITNLSSFPVDTLDSRGVIYGLAADSIGGYVFELSTCTYPNPFISDPLWKSPSNSWIVLIKEGDCAIDIKVDNVITLTGLSTLRGVLYTNGTQPIISPVKGLPVYHVMDDFNNNLSELLKSIDSSQRLSLSIGVATTSGLSNDSTHNNNALPFVLGVVIAVLAVLFAVSVFMHFRQWRINGRLRRRNSVESEFGAHMDSAGNHPFTLNNSNTDNLLVMAQSVVNALPIKTWSRKSTKKNHLHLTSTLELKPKSEKPAKLIPENLSPKQENEPDSKSSSSLQRPITSQDPAAEQPEPDKEKEKLTNEEQQTGNESDSCNEKHIIPQASRHHSIASRKSHTSHMTNASVSSAVSISTVGDNTCAVCMEDYVDGDRLRELPCKHLYHSSCIDKWLTSRSIKCPLCNQDAGPGVAAVQNIYINAFRYTYYDETNTLYEGSLPRPNNPNNLSPNPANTAGNSSTSNSGSDGSISPDSREAPWHTVARHSVAITFPPPAVDNNGGERRSRHFLRFGVGRSTGGG